MSLDDVPNGRCGFVSSPNDRGEEDVIEELDKWFKDTRAVCCWRPTWADFDRCIWHAETRDKPLGSLRKALSGLPERLDGAFLVGTRINASLYFEDCSLQRATLFEARLDGVDFSGTDLSKSDIAESLIEDSDFSESLLPRANLRRSRILNTNLSRAYLPETDFTEATLEFVNAVDAVFSRASFTGAKILEADFSNAHLYSTDLVGADLQDINFTDAHLPDTDLTDADLRGIDFTDADLQDADLTDVDLRDGDLNGVSLRNADLTDANLQGCDFTDADLRNSDFTDADLTEADFSSTSLQGADLTGAKLTDVDFSGARLSSNTRLPLTPPMYSVEEDPAEASETYRRLAQLLAENGQRSEASRARILSRRLERYDAWEKGEFLRFLHNTVFDHLALFGESPGRVVQWAFMTILTFGLLYPFVGGLETGAEIVAVNDILSSPNELVEAFLYGLEFSVGAFAFGTPRAITPATEIGRILASIESLLGMGLFALFVFALIKREVSQ